MRALFGFVLGIIVTIGAAYIYDSSTGRAPNGLSSAAADGQAPLVNWDVVSAEWTAFQAGVHKSLANLEHSLKRYTG